MSTISGDTLDDRKFTVVFDGTLTAVSPIAVSPPKLSEMGAAKDKVCSACRPCPVIEDGVPLDDGLSAGFDHPGSAAAGRRRRRHRSAGAGRRREADAARRSAAAALGGREGTARRKANTGR